MLLFGRSFFGLDISDNGVSFGGGVLSASLGSKVSGVVTFSVEGVEGSGRGALAVSLLICVAIGGSVFWTEDPAALSGSVATFDGSNGMSSQQVSRMKTCLSFVLSGSKCS